MAWIALIIAGLFEMLGVFMINRLHDKRNWQSFLLLVFSFGVSFLFLSIAMTTMPMGTAYAIWTGIGASGGAILSMVLYNEPREVKRIIFIAMIIGAVIGLKLIS
ncbi:DMT family transporter [Pseudogracilibacillus auburnensis]|uniref:Paired small multidrug resistance pump n=1 Tax=Pseudogracilibacillus auburnensis TaxID=1494959 RepID=A0A2V3WDA2_9BACI|nr:multidrug efflux SMR transporter [Pseudogracilibacillus auburnensis]MBO1001961.1 multidrug efflux SMR transporter [Pseudogracilibacillus auburnensis]PXW90185.1 paired small multidrug resistance pump [Pseudogracilibacillus auburnensis]